MKNPENSTCLPGKKDATNDGVTKYALNDTLSNLHKKFVNENPEMNISMACFAKCRPKYIKGITVAARRQCLCVYHQNGVLKLKALKIKDSVDSFLANNTKGDH